MSSDKVEADETVSRWTEQGVEARLLHGHLEPPPPSRTLAL
jgi:hypothetical protein